ncbi:MAG: N-acetyltransferase [Pseudomonadota bacterium]
MCCFQLEEPAHHPSIETLLDRVFGADRGAKPSYALRAGVQPIADLARVAIDGGKLVGTIRYWPIRVGQAPALLLGPLGVDPMRRGEGIGRRLVRDSLTVAQALGWNAVFLVGDLPYYAPLGFEPAGAFASMKRQDPTRLLGQSVGDARSLPEGVLQPAPMVQPAVG